MARKTKQTASQDELIPNENQSSGNTYVTEPVDDSVMQGSRCGGALSLARKSQGLSIHDIASRLRLSAKQIEAIEADNFAALPEPTIVRGFIRNYAKQLKIDAAPLLDAYHAMMPSATPHELIVKPSAKMKISSHEKPKLGVYVMAGLVLLLGFGAWLFYQNYIAKPSPITPVTTGVSSTDCS
jgi:cytoskeleton protein RodZ